MPLSFGVVPDDKDRLDVVIEIEAIGADRQVMFTRRAITSFVLKKKLLLPMFLARPCRAITCTEGQTCTERACEADVVDPGKLSEVEPGREFPPDAGIALRICEKS